MLSYLSSKEKAHQQYTIAEHLLKVTFPLTQDYKLLIGIMYTIDACLEQVIAAIILRSQSQVPAQFSARIAHLRNTIDPKTIAFLQEVHEIVILHRHSSTVFQRGQGIVICEKQYELKILTIPLFTHYLAQTQELLMILDKKA